MKVPFLDLKAQYLTIKDEIDSAMQDVINNTAFAGGPFVKKFEEEFATYCQTDYAVGVGSGTEALWLALLAFDIGPGDEVITVPDTFIATTEAINWCGATPVFVDIDEKTYNMDPELIEAAVTNKTKAIIPVHLFGQMADMGPIMAIAKKHKLTVIEDACQAHGAEYKGKRAGSIGDAGCFSFYPGKNLGAYGEAGGVVTNNQVVYNKICMIRDHGQAKKYYHDIVGLNSRMDGIQGAVLSVKLKHLNDWNAARTEHAEQYNKLLKCNKNLIIPFKPDSNKHVYHLYVVRVKNRDKVLEELKEEEIYCGIHYPVPLHLQKAYSNLGYKRGDFPITERCTDEFLSLPMFAELSDDKIDAVCNKMKI